MTPEVLDDRRLNRALLHRQGLLARTATPVDAMLEQLVGMQAQVPSNPYLALWSRLRDFDPASLSGMLERREAVRAQVMRSTIHLHTARDLLRVQPLTASVLRRTFKSPWAKGLAGADAEEVAAFGEALLREAPASRATLREPLGARWPGADPEALAQAVTFHVPLVQVPPRGLWGGVGQATWAPTEQWLDAPLDPGASLTDLVLRYLRAFGPASTADLRTWCTITGLKPVVDALRPDLRVFHDKRGRELLDVPDGPLPDPDVPAPPRFLPEYDNVLLSHDDRSRMLSGRGPGLPQPRGRWFGQLLVDGFFGAFWQVEASDGVATLTVDRYTAQPTDAADTREAIEEEARGLLMLIAPDAERHEVGFGDLS